MINFLKKMIYSLNYFLHRNEYRISIHGFNNSGMNTETFFGIVYELYNGEDEYRETKDPYKSYLCLPHNISFLDYVINSLKLLDNLNNVTEESHPELYRFLEDNKEKQMVVTLHQRGKESVHHRVLVLVYKKNQWVILGNI